MHNDTRPEIVLVGGGPRGVSLLERLVATLRADATATPLTIHIIDDVQVGAGRIWRTDQTRELCMNTLAGAVTLFTDDSVSMDGQVVVGPTLYEWAALAAQPAHLRLAGSDRAFIDASHSEAFAQTPVRAGLVAEYGPELRAIRPESHPSRALYGEYIRWCFAHAVQSLPAIAEVRSWTGRVIDVRPFDGRHVVVLSDGRELAADAIVLATGWLPRAHTPEERRIHAAVSSSDDLIWVRPDSPVDQRLEAVPAGEPAIVRGLGMGFFDAMALLTVGRGGRFVSDPTATVGLRYVPTGREPILHVTSHRGLPYRAKSLYGGLPPRSPQPYLRSVDWSAVTRPIDFDAQLWPLIVKDAYVCYYQTLARVRPDSLTGGLETVLRAIEHAQGDAPSLSAAVAPFIAEPADRFDYDAEVDLAAGAFASPQAFDEWVIRFVARDLADARAGVDSPLKAALWSLSSARQPSSRIGAFGGFDAESRIAGFRRLHAIGGMAGSGPPAFRNQQLVALAEAGVVHFIGPAASVAIECDRFQASSPAVADSSMSARILIDAWMHFHDVDESADPLIQSLIAQGRARAFAVSARSGGRLTTAGLDVDAATGRLIGADGALDAVVHVAGIPIEDTMHDSIISPMPGSDATMLRETDRVARSALRIALAAAERPRIATTRGVTDA